MEEQAQGQEQMEEEGLLLLLLLFLGPLPRQKSCTNPTFVIYVPLDQVVQELWNETVPYKGRRDSGALPVLARRRRLEKESDAVGQELAQ